MAILAEEGLDILGVFDDSGFVAVVAVDEDYEVGGLEFHLGALVIAGRRPYPTLSISIYR